MKLSHKLRKIWHDVFYKHASKDTVDFALKCLHVTGAIDLHQKPKTLSDRLRFYLHLSICQACKNYYDFSAVLTGAVNKNQSRSMADLDRINKSLISKYGRDNGE